MELQSTDVTFYICQNISGIFARKFNTLVFSPDNSNEGLVFCIQAGLLTNKFTAHSCKAINSCAPVILCQYIIQAPQ